ncbi:MAG: glycoside hydrolase TIM-barrel-like domain-containing protein, partial [Pseudomonadota bacterium]
ANIEGGEGYDWYYATGEDRAFQNRTLIQDVTESEPWVFRYKDIRGWWENPHYNRVNGVRSLSQTPWVPQSKPIWFTELGCAAVDKATNQPNKFIDPKSSESQLPHFSSGARDELIQMQYVRAMYGHWGNPDNNPVSTEYGTRMIDMTRAHVWAWDARPFPAFPDYLNVWSDGENYALGHWINGRSNARPLDSLVREICAASGVLDVDVSQLYGYVRGYDVPNIGSARAALQPLMLAYGFDAVERGGTLIFRNRHGQHPVDIAQDQLVQGAEDQAPLTLTRDPQAELADRVRLTYISADGAFATASTETIFPADDTRNVAQTELNLALTEVEAQWITERWLAESRVARDTATFALPPSQMALGVADIIALDEPGGQGTYRIDRVETAGERRVDAVRIEHGTYDIRRYHDVIEGHFVPVAPPIPLSPVLPVFLDLPLLSGDERPHAPHVAITAAPWPGGAAVYHSRFDGDYALLSQHSVAATLGTTQA